MQTATTMNLNYPNGDRYSGEVAHTTYGPIPNGSGIKYYANGDVYSGSFFNNQFHGQGTYRSLNGDYYKGQYCYNLRHGQGESYDTSKQRRYTGGFVNGVEEGYATITRIDCAIRGGTKCYVGFVKNGRREGYGKLTLTGSRGLPIEFEGQWNNGVLNGVGRQINPDECLSGIFVNGYFEGPGTRTNLRTGIINQITFQRGVPK